MPNTLSILVLGSVLAAAGPASADRFVGHGGRGYHEVVRGGGWHEHGYYGRPYVGVGVGPAYVAPGYAAPYYGGYVGPRVVVRGPRFGGPRFAVRGRWR